MLWLCLGPYYYLGDLKETNKARKRGGESHIEQKDQDTTDTPKELVDLAKQIIPSPPLPKEIEGASPERIEDWMRSHPKEAEQLRAAWQFYDQTVQHLVRLMQRDPWTPELLRRILAQPEEQNPSISD